jgi:hypothetical protein
MRLKYADPSPLKVTPNSPIALRRSVELIADHFQQEMNFSFRQFHAKETPDTRAFIPWEAYLFHERGDTCENDLGKNKVQFFGACCFRKNPNIDEGGTWAMDRVWLHPYFRSRGHLRQAWQAFRSNYGDFQLSEPLSPSMMKFVERISRFEPKEQ